MATGRLPDPNSAPVTAKGDLYTYSTVPAKLAVGNNGETLVADSSTSTGLRWQGNFAAGKNAIINGDFRIWQRGTSFSGLATDGYFADRWGSNWTAGTGSNTFSQQTFTPGTAPVAGYEGQFFARCAVTGANSSTQIGLRQRIEDVRTFAGQTMTISFWAKADASRSVNILTQQNFGSGGSAEIYGTATSVSVTTSWARYSATFSIPSISGKTIGTSSFFGVFIYLPIGSLSGSANLDVWGVQAEVGSVATAFQTATGTLAGELCAAQRYYQRFNIDADGHTGFIGNAYLTTASSVTRGSLVSMRTTPSSVDYSNVNLYDGVTFYAITGLTIWAATENHTFALLATGATGLTQYRSYFLVSNGAAGFVALSAEL